MKIDRPMKRKHIDREMEDIQIELRSKYPNHDTIRDIVRRVRDNLRRSRNAKTENAKRSPLNKKRRKRKRVAAMATRVYGD